MDYFRQVREQDFELNISLSEALYRRGEESITFQLNQDGLVECNGSKQCLHDLYQVLSLICVFTTWICSIQRVKKKAHILLKKPRKQ